MIFNAHLDGEELKKDYRTEAPSAADAIPEIIDKMQRDSDTAPDAAYKAYDATHIAVYRDGEFEQTLEVLPAEEN